MQCTALRNLVRRPVQPACMRATVTERSGWVRVTHGSRPTMHAFAVATARRCWQAGTLHTDCPGERRGMGLGQLTSRRFNVPRPSSLVPRPRPSRCRMAPVVPRLSLPRALITRSQIAHTRHKIAFVYAVSGQCPPLRAKFGESSPARTPRRPTRLTPTTASDSMPFCILHPPFLHIAYLLLCSSVPRCLVSVAVAVGAGCRAPGTGHAERICTDGRWPLAGLAGRGRWY